MDNGDQIKYNDKGEIEWAFSPRYGWNEMRSEVIEEIKSYKFTRDFFRKYMHFDDNEEVGYVYRNNFFIKKAVGKWLFRVHDRYLSEEDGLISPYVPQKPDAKFEKFQWVKVFRNDKTYWVNE
jgi:hypothetical protein